MNDSQRNHGSIVSPLLFCNVIAVSVLLDFKICLILLASFRLASMKQNGNVLSVIRTLGIGSRCLLIIMIGMLILCIMLFLLLV